MSTYKANFRDVKSLYQGFGTGLGKTFLLFLCTFIWFNAIADSTPSTTSKIETAASMAAFNSWEDTLLPNENLENSLSKWTNIANTSTYFSAAEAHSWILQDSCVSGPTAVASEDITICERTTAQLSATGGVSYVWSPATGLSDPFSATPAAMPAVTTTYVVQVTDDKGCTDTDDVTVTVLNHAAVSAGPDRVMCLGNSTQLSASGGIFYTWSPSNGLSNPNSINPIASPDLTTTYTVVATDENGCEATADVTISIGKIEVSAGIDQTICDDGSSTQLTATGGVTYAWSPATGLSDPFVYNPTARPTATTTYSVTVTDSEGCKGVDEVVLNVQPCNTLNPCAGFIPVSYPDRTICSGNITQLNASGGVSYLWNPTTALDNPAIANPIASPTTTTTYTVTITNESGCTTTDQITVSVSGKITASAGSDQSVFIDCDNVASGAQLNATGGIFYSWTPTTGLSNPNIPNPIASPRTPTNYSVTVTDASGCAGFDNVYVAVAVADCFSDNNGNGIDDASETPADPNPNDPCSTTYSKSELCAFIFNNPGSPLATSDCDGGGIINAVECANGGNPLDPTDDDPTVNVDSDGDGITNSEEIAAGTNPNDPCSNNYTAAELCAFIFQNPSSTLATTDCDNGGMINAVECANGANPLNASDDNSTGFIDKDGDGLSDDEEVAAGTNPNNPCSNNYTLEELCAFILQNPSSALAIADCDGGGLSNILECTNGGNSLNPGDDIPLINTDSDGDGLAYSVEIAAGTNPNDPCSNTYSAAELCTFITNNPGSPLAAADCDNGSIRNAVECANGGNPLNPADDTVDFDGDGISDNVEISAGTDPSDPCSNTYSAAELCAFISNNPNGPLSTTDCDNDGFINAVECANGNNPLNPTDNNLVNNTDSDGDGITDNAEVTAGTNPNDPCSNTYSATELCAFISNNINSPLANTDCDNDGISNAVECATGKNPLNPADNNPVNNTDSDGDGITDNAEVTAGTNPNDPCSNNYSSAALCAFISNNTNSPLANTDCDNDGISNAVECATGKNPLDGRDNITNPNTGCNDFVIYECPDKIFCGNRAAQLVVNGGVSWVWSPATGLDNPNSDIPKASPNVTTTYTVTATAANGCTASAEVVVTVANELKVYGGENQTICNGQTAQLNGQGGVRYQWSPSNGLSNANIANPTASPSTTTTYTLTVTGPAGCTGTDQVTISVGKLDVNATQSATTTCQNEPVQLSATGGIFYQWSPSTGLSSTNIANPTANPSVTTVYTVTVTDDTGCTGTTDMTIGVNAGPQVNAGADVSICNNGSLQLNASGSATYQWSPATGLNNTNISNPVANPATTTTYTVVGTDVYGCTSTDQVTVTVGPFVAEACEDKQICQGESFQLIVSSGASYQWSPTGTLDNPTAAAPVANPTSTTTYTVTVTNEAGCTSVDEVILYVHTGANANAGADISACPTTGAQLQATGGMNYQWSPTTGLSNAFIANPVANPGATTVYTVSVMDFNGCTSTDQMTYEVRTDCTPPTCSSILDQEEICADGDNIGRVCLPFNTTELANYRITTSTGIINPTHGCNFTPLYAYTYAILPNLGNSGTYTIESWTVNGTTYTGTVRSMNELANWMQSKDPTGNWANISNNYFIQGGNTLSTYGQLVMMHEETWIETTLSPSSTGVNQGTLVEIDMSGKDAELLTIVNLTNGCSDKLVIKKCTTPRCTQNLVGEIYETAILDCNGQGTICIPVKLESILQYEVTVNNAPYSGELQPCYANASYAYTYFTIPEQGRSGPYQINSWFVNDKTFTGSFSKLVELISWMNEKDPAGNWTLDETTLSIRGGIQNSNYGEMSIVQLNTRSKATLNVNTNLTPNGTELTFAIGTHQVGFFNTVNGCSEEFTVIVACLPTATINGTIVENQTGSSCLEIAADRTVISIENVCADNTAGMFEIDEEFQCVNYEGASVGDHQACIVVCDDRNLCDTTYVNITVTPKANFLPRAEQDTSTTEGTRITVLNITANDRATSAVSIEIIEKPAHGRAIVNPDNTVSYEADEGYCNSTIADKFSYRICNEHGCDEATAEVFVKCPGIQVNEGFSPNNDGINDYLTIEGLQEYPNNELTIFNRWGTVIFKQKGYDGTWDGSFNDLPLPDGTYFYILTDGAGAKYSGFVQINR